MEGMDRSTQSAHVICAPSPFVIRMECVSPGSRSEEQV